jgi:hypothetical protein
MLLEHFGCGHMSTTHRSLAIAAGAVLIGLATINGAATAGPLVADSVAEFSGVQGLDGWSYGYYDGDAPSAYAPADFQPLPQFDGANWLIEETAWNTGGPMPSGFWTRLSAIGGHPNGDLTTTAHSANHWAVRRWSSDRRALYTITGVLSDNSPALNPPPPQAAYNGVVGHIFVDGNEVLTLPLNEGGSVNYSLTVPLSAGAIVDFAIDAKTYATNPDRTSDFTDSTTFTVQVFVPEPTTLHLVTATRLASGLSCRCFKVANRRITVSVE